jgi:hypothetical protein
MTDPKIVENLLSKEDYETLYEHLFNLNKESDWGDEESGTFLSADPELGRHLYADQVIEEYGEKLVPLAREIFNSKTLLMSYSLFCHYEGEQANLFKHKDSNACTYTLDMCLYQTEPWDLYVEGKAYTLYPNQGLAFLGEEQEHWREAYPNPDTQKVGMVFFHFVEPDHWFFEENPDKLKKGMERWPKWQAFTQKD